MVDEFKESYYKSTEVLANKVLTTLQMKIKLIYIGKSSAKYLIEVKISTK